MLCSHTIKSILRENPRKVVWLFSLSYIKVHRWRQRQTLAAKDETVTADDEDSGLRRQQPNYCPLQSAYRSAHSTETALVIIIIIVC